MRKCMRNCRQAVRSLVIVCLMLSTFIPVFAQEKDPALQKQVTVTGSNMSILQVFRSIKNKPASRWCTATSC